MDTTLEREDESAGRVTRPLADVADQPAVTDEPTQPDGVACVEIAAQPTGHPARPLIRRAVEHWSRSWSRPWSLPRLRLQHEPRPQREPRPRPRRRWLRLAWRVVKTVLLTAELGAALVLASYAGLIKILPASPPRLNVAATGHTVVAQATSYCWFTPGSAACVDASEQAVPTGKLPHATIARGDDLRLTFAYPAPTHCTASAVASADPGASSASLGALGRAAGSSSFANSRLPVALSPGTYVLTIACSWAPRSTMRWLQGQGSSSYVLAVVVTARR